MSLTPEERETYAWQIDLPGFGAAAQEKLKASTVLISRVGGVGGAAAYALAAAGVGRLVLAHAGPLRPDDLNRQTLMTHAGIGQPRMASAVRRLKELNPRLEVEGVEENISEANAARLAAKADLVLGAAPLFAERLLMNRECVKAGKPYVDAAMFGMELRVMSVWKSPCLACLYPEEPPAWKRRFPVLGAVAHAAGAIGATEAVKILTGLGEPLAGRMLIGSLSDMSFQTIRLKPTPCPHGR
jgi:molybdopterin/thiamine biosynthesis adenylyltransferase